MLGSADDVDGLQSLQLRTADEHLAHGTGRGRVENSLRLVLLGHLDK